MHVGVVLPQTDWKDLLDQARFAEEAGADSVWVVDHLLGFPVERGILEAWTVMSALAASTQKVELGAQVLCQSFRNPALLAKMAATLDQVSGGRLRLLIGSGWFENEYKAFGMEFPAPGRLIDELRDTIRIVKGMLSSAKPFTYDGKYYFVKDAINAPQPVKMPMPVEVGGARDRLLRLVAREADGWNCPGVALPMVEERVSFLRSACERYGRKFEDLRLSCQIVCSIGEEGPIDQRLSFFAPEHGLVGSVDKVVDRAGQLIEMGFEGFHVIVAGGTKGRDSLERLIREVKPKLG